jgi:hypothetical protein
MLAQEVIGGEERPQVKSKRLVDSLADQLEAIGTSANELLKATKSTPTGEQVPLIERKLVVEPKPIVEPRPVVEIKPAIAQKAAVEPTKVVIEPRPVVAVPKPATPPQPPVAAPKPVVAQKPAVEPRPAPETVKPIPVVEQKPATEHKPVAVPQKEPEQVTVADAFMTQAPVAAPAARGLQTLAESVAQTTSQLDAKLSEYYGVSQMQDAVVFVTLYPRAGAVAIAGDFNNWQPGTTPMQRVGDTGVWQTKMKLPHGTYRYRLVVDGQWQQDPYNERSELNPYGEYNSILEVK